MDRELPVMVNGPRTQGSSEADRAASMELAPKYTPVLDPATLEGLMFAYSNISQASSRASRCCGSMDCASRSDTPKNLQSNQSMSSTTPAAKVMERPAAERRPCRKRSRLHRWAGISVTPSTPLISSSQKSSHERTPPGSRTPIPTIAILQNIEDILL
jgi:hypothetical protein